MGELNRRYVVTPLATEAPFDHADPDGVFVLKPWKDPAALRALVAYRENCYPELAADLEVWIGVIEAGPTVRGDVGRRNERHVKPEGAGSGGGAGRRSGRKAARPAKRVAARKRAAARGAGAKPGRARTTRKPKKRGR